METKKRHKATDIKHGGSLSLTAKEIQEIPINLVYMWIRSGEWKQKDFLKWCKAMMIVD